MSVEKTIYERLWAPWRLAYVSGEAGNEETADQTQPVELPTDAAPHCFICRALAADDDRRNLVVCRGERTVTILNRFPYNNGHVLVAPRRHVGDLLDIDGEEHRDLIEEISRLVGVLRQELNAEGFHVGLNLGEAAGAGLPGHLHWHIVPRWHGDTNFMPTLAGVRVMPQSLDALWQLLHDRQP